METITVVDPMWFLMMFMVACFIATLMILVVTSTIIAVFVGAGKHREHVATADRNAAQAALDEALTKDLLKSPLRAPININAEAQIQENSDGR